MLRRTLQYPYVRSLRVSIVYATRGSSPLYFFYDTNGITLSGGLPTAISTNSTQSQDCQSGMVDTHSTCLAYDAQDRLNQVKLPNGSSVSMTYNTAGQRASYTVVLSGTSQPSFQELFTYRGDQIGQVLYAGTSITDPYTDTYLYGGDGGA